MDVKLVVVGGAASKHEIRLQLPVIVGRADDAGLTVKHPTVSRKHCELFERDGLAMVSDLGSTNGTLVDGVQINEAMLRPGERLTIGPLTFEVVYDLAPAREPRAPVVNSAAAAPAPPPLVTSEDELEIPFELSDTSPAAETPLPPTEATDDDLLLDPEALEIHAEHHELADAPAADADLGLGSLELDDDLVVDDFLTAPPAEEPAAPPASAPRASAAVSPSVDEPIFEIPEPLPAGEGSIVDDEDSLFGDLDLDARPVEEFADGPSGDDSPDSGIGWLTVSGTPPAIEVPLELAAERLPPPEPAPAAPAPPAAPIANEVPGVGAAPSMAVQRELDFDPGPPAEIAAADASLVAEPAMPADLPPSIEEPLAAIAPASAAETEEPEPELMEFESLELDGELEFPPLDDEAASLAPQAEPAEAVEPEVPAATEPTTSDPLAADPWLNIEEGLDLPPIELDESPSADVALASPEASSPLPESTPAELAETANPLPPSATDEPADEWLDELFGIEEGAAAENAAAATDEPLAPQDAESPALASGADETLLAPLDELGSAELEELPPLEGEPIDALDSTFESEPLLIDPELEVDVEPAEAALAAPPESTDPAVPLVADLPPVDLPTAESPVDELPPLEPALSSVEPATDELDDLFEDIVDEPPTGAEPEAVEFQETPQPPGQHEPPVADADPDSLFGDLDSGPFSVHEQPDSVVADDELADAIPPVAADKLADAISPLAAEGGGPAVQAGDLDSAEFADLFADEASDVAPISPPATEIEELFTEEASLELDLLPATNATSGAESLESAEVDLLALEPSPDEPPLAEPSEVGAADLGVDFDPLAPPAERLPTSDFTSPPPGPPAPLTEEPATTKTGRGWWPFGRKKGAGDGGPDLAAGASPEPAPAPAKPKSRALTPLAPPQAESPPSDEPPAPPRRFFGLLGGGKPKPKQIPVYAPRPPVGGPSPGILPPSVGPAASSATAAAPAPVVPASAAAPSAAAELTPEVELADLDLPAGPADPAGLAEQPPASSSGRNGSAPHAEVNDEDFASFLDSLDDDK